MVDIPSIMFYRYIILALTIVCIAPTFARSFNGSKLTRTDLAYLRHLDNIMPIVEAIADGANDSIFTSKGYENLKAWELENVWHYFNVSLEGKELEAAEDSFPRLYCAGKVLTSMTKPNISGVMREEMRANQRVFVESFVDSYKKLRLKKLGSHGYNEFLLQQTKINELVGFLVTDQNPSQDLLDSAVTEFSIMLKMTFEYPGDDTKDVFNIIEKKAVYFGTTATTILKNSIQLHKYTGDFSGLKSSFLKALNDLDYTIEGGKLVKREHQIE